MRSISLRVAAVASTAGSAGLLLAFAFPAVAGLDSQQQPRATAAPVERVAGGSTAARTACVDNLGGDDFDPLSSQNFERANNAYDSMAADDFTLSSGCTVTEVDVEGRYYNNPGTHGGASENVTFYKDDNGDPGRVIAADTVIAKDNGSGSFRIHLPAFRLKPGTYWLSVQLNMNSIAYGQWGWDNSTQRQGSPALWKNPGDGFGTGCTSWSPAQTCLKAPGPDMVFAILGKGTTDEHQE